ncbi:MAG: hypothetical protein KatS3mg050_1279 [Litorilinea sp.]|nr:MAG: hypothetical protein KatS3mg050_1279 [Litorilinea sp.]
MHVSVSIAKGSPVQKAVPAEYRARFLHLYWDIAWFGILAGSSMAFLSVYAARLGADAFQIGLLNAGPAAVGLLFTMPAGHWLRRRSVGKAVFWSAVAGRIHYLWWIFLPLLLPAQSQIWLFILLVLLMTIPGTVLAVGFNALYAAAVPPEWRSHVVGIRNALLSLVYVATSLLCGYILDHTPLHTGYAIIFGLGFVGAVMSTVHLWFLRQTTPEELPEEETIRAPLGDFARPGHIRLLGLNLRTAVGLRAFTRSRDLLRLEVLQGRYGRVVAALFAFHFAQYLPIPIFPLYWVEQLHFNDGSISLGTAAFPPGGAAGFPAAGPPEPVVGQPPADGGGGPAVEQLPPPDGLHPWARPLPGHLPDRRGGLVHGGWIPGQLPAGADPPHGSAGLPGLVQPGPERGHPVGFPERIPAGRGLHPF